MNAFSALIDRFSRPDQWPLIAALISAGLLAGAYAFEIFGDYPPCPLCVEQRWAHLYIAVAAALLYAGLAVIKPGSAIARAGVGLIAVGFFSSAWLAGRHAGMEYGFWEIPCQSMDFGEPTAADLFDALDQPRNVVPCDEAAWWLFGVSMAGYNALISAAAGAMSLISVFRTPYRRPQ